MLNTISVILLSFIITSCSKSNEAKQAERIQDEQENVIELAPLELKSIAEANYQLLPQPGSALNFGSLEFGQVVEQKIIIRNPNTIDLVFSSSDIDASQIAPF